MATVEMKESSFKNASNLKNCVCELLDKKEITIDDILQASQLRDYSSFLIKIDTDKKCHEALFECLKDFTVDKIPITEELMEINSEVRNDYYKLIKECFDINMLPFIGSLRSLLLEMSQKNATE